MTLPNEASAGLHRAMGFEPIGIYRLIGWKLGAWHDVAWMQRTLGVEHDPPRAEPRRPGAGEMPDTAFPVVVFDLDGTAARHAGEPRQ